MTRALSVRGALSSKILHIVLIVFEGLQPKVVFLDNVFDQVGKFFTAMGDVSRISNLEGSVSLFFQDPLNTRFGQDLARFSRDLLFDSEGKLSYKPELWLDIRKVILPTLIERVGYVPIPRIEYTDDNLDLVVENLTLSGPNLFPKCRAD